MGEIANLVTAAVLLTGSDATDGAMRAFEELGFFPQVVAEATLLISGPERLFEERFGAEIVFAPGGPMAFRADDGPDLARDLPLDRLDPALRGAVRAVGFQARIDFGPTGFDQRATLSEEATMPVLSAAVILRDGADTQAAHVGFARLGFEVQTISEGVLLLTAEAKVFEKGFRIGVILDEAGPRRQAGGEETRQLPPEALPEGLREHVREIEFEAPPDFGPTDF